MRLTKKNSSPVFRIFFKIFLPFLFFLSSLSAKALMPPAELETRNLEASVIVLGSIEETGKILLTGPLKAYESPQKGLFVLKILHVIKGRSILKGKKILRIVYNLSAEKIKGSPSLLVKKMGSLPIRVKKGEIVVVYLKASPHPPFFRLVAGGASLFVIKNLKQQPLPRN